MLHLLPLPLTVCAVPKRRSPPPVRSLSLSTTTMPRPFVFIQNFIKGCTHAHLPSPTHTHKRTGLLICMHQLLYFRDYTFTLWLQREPGNRLGSDRSHPWIPTTCYLSSGTQREIYYIYIKYIIKNMYEWILMVICRVYCKGSLLTTGKVSFTKILAQ